MKLNWLESKVKAEKKKLLQNLKRTGISSFSGLQEVRPLSYNFAAQSSAELLQELSDRLCSLNELIDNRQFSFRSHRPRLGWLLTLYKKLIHLFLRPYIGSILERQRSFNEAVVQFLLAHWYYEKKLESEKQNPQNSCN